MDEVKKQADEAKVIDGDTHILHEDKTLNNEYSKTNFPSHMKKPFNNNR
jgi:hypothetical protein